MNITFLLHAIHKDSDGVKFQINRHSKSCHTPRRNEEIDKLLKGFDQLTDFVNHAFKYFMEELFPVQVDHGIDLNAIREEEEKEEEKEKRKSSSIFVPVLPLFDKKHRGSGVVPLDYMKPYLEEQTRSMVERFQELDKVFSSFLIGLRNSHNIFVNVDIF